MVSDITISMNMSACEYADFSHIVQVREMQCQSRTTLSTVL
jgi:hypothetical protein